MTVIWLNYGSHDFLTNSVFNSYIHSKPTHFFLSNVKNMRIFSKEIPVNSGESETDRIMQPYSSLPCFIKQWSVHRPPSIVSGLFFTKVANMLYIISSCCADMYNRVLLHTNCIALLRRWNVRQMDYLAPSSQHPCMATFHWQSTWCIWIMSNLCCCHSSKSTVEI